MVSQKIKEHANDITKPPLLVRPDQPTSSFLPSHHPQVFPEGTCVNNEYVVMFKRGAFDLGMCECMHVCSMYAHMYARKLKSSPSHTGTSIVPVAIKYNKVFVDAFWNSKQQSFAQHMLALMCSWALVVDVYYLVCCHRTIHTYIHTYKHTDIHTYIHPYIHTYIHTYIRTNIHACIFVCICNKHFLKPLSYLV